MWQMVIVFLLSKCRALDLASHFSAVRPKLNQKFKIKFKLFGGLNGVDDNVPDFHSYLFSERCSGVGRV